MAMQGTSSVTAPSAEIVGNAFVEQYYHILHKSPELVHRFYQDSSLLSRPDADGGMTTVTTMQVSYLGTFEYIHTMKVAFFFLLSFTSNLGLSFFVNLTPFTRWSIFLDVGTW